MWPGKRSERLDPLEYATELRKAVELSWNGQAGLQDFFTDEDSVDRFFFSSYILAMLFFGSRLHDSAHSILPTYNKKVLKSLSMVFPSMDGGISTVGKYIVNAGEIMSDFPSHAKDFGIETDWDSCLALKIPMPTLIAVTYRMRFAILNRTLSGFPDVTPEQVREVWNPFSPLFTAAGALLPLQIFVLPSLLEIEDMNAFTQLALERFTAFRQYSFDLYGIIMQIIDKRS